jgi:hypothetical protein
MRPQVPQLRVSDPPLRVPHLLSEPVRRDRSRRTFLALGVEQAYKLALLISRVPFFFFPIMRPPSREIVFARDSAAALQREAGVRYLEILAARAGIAVRGPT